MRGPKPVYQIELTPDETEQLQQIIRPHKAPQANVV